MPWALKGLAMVIVYLVIEVLAAKADLLGAKRTGLLLKLSEYLIFPLDT